MPAGDGCSSTAAGGGAVPTLADGLKAARILCPSVGTFLPAARSRCPLVRPALAFFPGFFFAARFASTASGDAAVVTDLACVTATTSPKAGASGIDGALPYRSEV